MLLKKSRVIRGYHKSHVTKEMRKAIMKRSFYKNKVNQTGDFHYKKLYKKQKKIIVNLNRRAKQTFFQKLGTGSGDFWNACKPFFSNKSLKREKIALLDDSSNNLILDDSKVASVFNTFFINISRDLNIEPWETCLEQLGEDLETPDDIDLVLRKFANHPSISRVIHAMKIRDDVFSFSRMLSQLLSIGRF